MSKGPVIGWNRHDLPKELHAPLTALGEHYPLACDRPNAAMQLRCTHDPGLQGLRLARARHTADITYGQTHHALRGISALLGDLVRPGQTCEAHLPFGTLGIMLDCSRNAVMKVDHLKQWLRQLALLGYNMVMLYTEDTYELPDEPFFGYLRGRYSAKELREIDDYAATLGIEMIGCIQTLGHMERILKWPAYNPVKDTGSVMLAKEPATYELIDKMIRHFAATYRSRRIHIGMDETHDLGRGRYMDRFGYKRGFDIFNDHLAKVVRICRRHGLEPMIWSDMYFRMGSKTGEYYDTKAKIPADVVAKIPDGVDLVYWDYYHEDEAFYRDYIKRHRAMGKEPIMGSGVWTWGIPWHDFDHTRRAAGPCVAACRRQKVKELFFTMWGDDGAYCEFDSAMTGLAYMADLAYGCDAPEEKLLAKRYAAVCGASFPAVKAVSDLMVGGVHRLLWDDPLLRIGWHGMGKTTAQWKKLLAGLRKLSRTLAPSAHLTKPVDLAHAANLTEYLALKIDLSLALDAAYASGHKAALASVRRRIGKMTQCIDRLLTSFRRQWYRRNKPVGFELIQTRLAGMRQRYGELADRLDELAKGKISGIDELDEPVAAPKKSK